MSKATKSIIFFYFFFNVLIQATATAEDFTLEAYVKVRSMKEMAPKVMTIAKESQISMQKLAIPFFVLGVMGHPNYPSIQDGNVAWLIFRESDGSKHSFFLGKLVPNSNLENAVKALGWGIESYKGWTIIGKKASSIQKIANKDYLISFMQNTPKTGLEFFFFNKESTIPKNLDAKWVIAVMSLKTAQLSLDIHEKDISILGKLHSKEGESLDSFLGKLSKIPFTKKSIHPLNDQASVAITIDRADLPKIYQSISNIIDIEKETQKL